ncbi:rhodanese-like domain-containing protein [Deinococcus multiflagellatus]|uniref:Rhodanese-like domain-containing protein n=1 Tax=Deinococcus multiflagellatus TaxID=1656887 RepID=A0ABW1ZRT0_9DEIO|nr:rhodanese-like domain-containing protein [Deinococcus multiflagellatus]MBZ9715433.1 rhodanese-like domain-containing protein [Deinococcus multiflagellatus]
MTYQDIFTTELERKKRNGARLVDVREHEEYMAGHIPGATNLPLSELIGRADEIEPTTILICASGNRSSQAAAYLVSQGKTGVMNLSGGTAAWSREGRDLNRGEQP